MSLKKYKSIDILVFVVLSIGFELLNFIASTSFEDFRLVFMSYSIVLSIICIYRWGLVGSICAFAGGIAACISAKSTNYVQYIAYGLGNLTVIIPALIFQYKIGREKIASYKLIQIAYVIASFAIVITARCIIVSLFSIDSFGQTFIVNLKGEVVMESMSLVISILIMLIAGRKNGNMLVKMIDYIEDVQDRMKLGGLKEYKEQSNFNHDKPFTEENEIDESYLLDGGSLSKEQLKELDELFESDVSDKQKEKNDEHRDKE